MTYTHYARRRMVLLLIIALSLIASLRSAHAEEVGTIQQCLFAAPTFEATWRPGAAQEVVEVELTYDQFVAKDRELRPQGYRLRQMYTRVYKCGSNPSFARFTAQWRKESVDEFAVYWWKASDFFNKNNELKPQGWRLTMMDSFLFDGQIYYNAAWRRSTANQSDIYGWSWNDFVSKAQAMNSQGWTTTILDTHPMPDGTVRYNASWRQLGSDSAIYGWAPADFDRKYAEMRAAGWNTTTMSVFGSGTNARYNVSWRKFGLSEVKLKGLSGSQLKTEQANRQANGWSIAVLEGF